MSRINDLLSIATAISQGRTPEYQHNEGFTSGAFDLLLVHAKGKEAFDLLAELCDRYESHKSEGHGLAGYFILLTQLAHQSNTTEAPSHLQSIISENPDLSKALRVWYRYAE